MKSHIEQAKHNESFLALTEKHSPKDYFDWKITIIFYSALHYVCAYVKYKKCYLGKSHEDLDKIINPDNKTSKATIDLKYYNYYKELYNYSRQTRYNPYNNDIKLQLAECLYQRSKEHLQELKKHFKHINMIK